LGNGRSQPPKKSVVPYRGDHDHAGVLAQEIERPAKTAALVPITGNDFGFRWGISRRARLVPAAERDEIGEEADGREEDVPGLLGVLRFHDGADVECAGEEESADQCETQRWFRNWMSWAVLRSAPRME